MPKVYKKQSEIIDFIQSPSTMDSNLRQIKQRIINSEAPFYQINLGSVYQQFIRWKTLLPRVQPFFAIKCQPDPKIIALLGKLGAGFDCASKQEIKIVVDTLDYSPSQASTNMIFANPYKFKKDIIFAQRFGVNTVTFDTESELVKLSEMWPTVQLILRISPKRAYDATCVLGNKFGADRDDIPFLLQRAKELSMNIVGLSFHVGSGCNELNAFPETVVYCSEFMDLARRLGFNPTILDIGGGFPGLSSVVTNEDLAKQSQFENMCVKLNQALDKYFPQSENYKIIAEPGRYFVNGAYTLMTQVIGVRSLDLTNLTNSNTINIVACHDQEKAYVNDLSHDEFSSLDSIPDYLFDCLSDVSEMSDNEKLYSSKNHHHYHHQQYINEKGFRYVINDGVYNSFNCIVFDHAKPIPFGIFDNDGYFREMSNENELYLSTIFGPTCDGFDCVIQQEPLPKMEVGNWIVWPNMGAYTIAASSGFNGIEMAEKHYFMFQQDAADMETFLSRNVLKNRFEEDKLDNQQILAVVEVA